MKSRAASVLPPKFTAHFVVGRTPPSAPDPLVRTRPLREDASPEATAPACLRARFSLSPRKPRRQFQPAEPFSMRRPHPR